MDLLLMVIIKSYQQNMCVRVCVTVCLAGPASHSQYACSTKETRFWRSMTCTPAAWTSSTCTSASLSRTRYAYVVHVRDSIEPVCMHWLIMWRIHEGYMISLFRWKWPSCVSVDVGLCTRQLVSAATDCKLTTRGKTCFLWTAVSCHVSTTGSVFLRLWPVLTNLSLFCFSLFKV